jgi:hypothetical protein
MHTKSESDVTSLAPSSPRSPKRSQAYYVQSPSRDSHDEGGYKSSSVQDTPVFNSPNESPTHPSSFGPHSRYKSGYTFGTIWSCMLKCSMICHLSCSVFPLLSTLINNTVLTTGAHWIEMHVEKKLAKNKVKGKYFPLLFHVLIVAYYTFTNLPQYCIYRQ